MSEYLSFPSAIPIVIEEKNPRCYVKIIEMLIKFMQNSLENWTNVRRLKSVSSTTMNI